MGVIQGGTENHGAKVGKNGGIVMGSGIFFDGCGLFHPVFLTVYNIYAMLEGLELIPVCVVDEGI